MDGEEGGEASKVLPVLLLLTLSPLALSLAISWDRFFILGNRVDWKAALSWLCLAPSSLPAETGAPPVLAQELAEARRSRGAPRPSRKPL